MDQQPDQDQELTTEERAWIRFMYVDRDLFERDFRLLLKRYIRERHRRAYTFLPDETHEIDAGDYGRQILDVLLSTMKESHELTNLGASLQRAGQHAESVPDGFIYVLQAGRYYKIGRTWRLRHRIKTLKIQLPFPVRVVAAFPCQDVKATEEFLHQYNAEYRANGEWFILPDEGDSEPSSIEFLRRIVYCANEFVQGIGQERLAFRADTIPAAVWHQPQWRTALKECREFLEED